MLPKQKKVKLKDMKAYKQLTMIARPNATALT